MAAVAAPVMGPVSDAIVSSFGDTILVEIGMHVGFDLTTKVANDLILDKAIKAVIPIHSDRLQTTSVKELLITLKYKHTLEDASLGFYRSSLHKCVIRVYELINTEIDWFARDTSLFSNVMDYLATEKGWFSPYLFASGRRPIIPRSMKPDIVFCHGPFLPGKRRCSHAFDTQYLPRIVGDYRLGETLLAESAMVLSFTTAPPSTPEDAPAPSSFHASLSIPSRADFPSLSNLFSRSRTPSPEPQLTPLPAPPTPRRMVILVVGLKPHRAGLWTTSARPSESVMYYHLLNGCPAVVVPVKVGAPLVAWDTLTLEELWKVALPKEDSEATTDTGGFGGIVSVINEYLDLCVDWDRVVLSTQQGGADASEAVEDIHTDITSKKRAVKDALTLLIAAAVRSGESKEVKNKVDKERSGIAMWRIP